MKTHAAGESVRDDSFALNRRSLLHAATAELSQLAITADDVDTWLPSAIEIAEHALGFRIDSDAFVDGEWRGNRAQGRALDEDETAFISGIGHVLRLLRQRRSTERRVIAEIEGRFKRIFQNSPVALSMSTIDDGRIIDVNERWLSMFGFQREEVLGRTNAELGISPEASQRDAIITSARSLRMVRDVETRVRKRTGEIIDILLSALPLDTENQSQIWISACVEITGRKKAEAERDQLLSREQVARAEAEQALEKLRAVYAITDGVAAQTPGGDLLRDVLGRLRTTLQIHYATVLLLDDEGKNLYLRAMEGPPDEWRPVPDFRVPIGVGVSGRVAAEGRAMIVNDYSTIDVSAVQAADFSRLRQTASVMGAPIRINDRVAGVLMASSHTPRQFTEEELRLLLLAADRVGLSIERGRFIDRIRTGIARQRTLSRRLLTAQEEERRRLAVELHDELGQVLTAVKINLESLAQAKGPAPTFATMAATIQSVDEALLRVRDMALDLRPSVLDDLGLAAAIRWYTDRFARGAPIETHLSIDALPRLEPGLQTACFRVTQEALTNVERHARARHVWIDLHVLAGALELSVRDDGVGFDVAAARARAISGGSVGLLGMQERVSLLGGEYEIVQVPSGGTEVRARFPMIGAVS